MNARLFAAPTTANVLESNGFAMSFAETDRMYALNAGETDIESRTHTPETHKYDDLPLLLIAAGAVHGDEPASTDTDIKLL
jgi:hypothetical protein